VEVATLVRTAEYTYGAETTRTSEHSLPRSVRIITVAVHEDEPLVAAEASRFDIKMRKRELGRRAKEANHSSPCWHFAILEGRETPCLGVRTLN
jgi:hypothetical protein